MCVGRIFPVLAERLSRGGMGKAYILKKVMFACDHITVVPPEPSVIFHKSSHYLLRGEWVRTFTMPLLPVTQ